MNAAGHSPTVPTPTLPPTADGYPQLPAYEWGRTWYVPCYHCQKFHTHGAGQGHRLAHCEKPGSPFADSGYSLVHVGEWNWRVAAAWEHVWVAARKLAREEKRAAKERARTARLIDRAVAAALRKTGR